MSIIQFNDELLEPRKSKQLKLILIIAFVATVLLLRTTLAANISLGSGAALEFGQGVQVTTACTGSTPLTVTPNSSFTNSAGAGAFYFKSVKVSDIPSSCYGSQFVLSAYGETATAPLAIYNSSATEIAVYNNSGTFIDNVDNAVMTTTTNSTSSFTVTFVTPVAVTASVYRITIQSAVNTIPVTCQGGADCAVGDTSPDGVGRVFYVNNAGFACGPTLAQTCRYLAVAPANWAGTQNDSLKIWSTVSSTDVPAYNGVDATGTAIGRGLAQTNAIVNQGAACNSTACTYAAGAVRNYRSAGENWYLPTTGELAAMFASTYDGSYAQLVYFASTEANATAAFTVDNSNNQVTGDLKSNSRYVRPIRAF